MLAADYDSVTPVWFGKLQGQFLYEIVQIVIDTTLTQVNIDDRFFVWLSTKISVKIQSNSLDCRI